MKKIYLSGLLFFLVIQGMAQVLLNNVINDANPSAYNPFTLGQTVAGNITASGIGRGSGISGNAGSNRYNAANWSTGSMDMNDYFEFTFTPAAGYEIDFTSFVYTAQKSGTGPSSYAFRSSVDGFVSNIGSPGQTSGNISLTAAAYQNISGPITFRYYAWGASGSTGTYSINDFSFNGNVSLAVSNAISTTGTYSSYCNGVPSSVSVSFSPTGSFTGNFTAQLSDASGSFASPTVIGWGSSSPISATIPSGMAAGNAYRIRVIHSGSNTIGADNGSNISLLVSPVVNLGNDTAYCMGTVFNLSLDAQNTGSSYEWSNLSTSQTLHVAQAGTFSVTVTAPNTCETTDAITVSELALPQVDLGVDLAYCIGTSFSHTLDAGNSGATYNWNNGAATTQTYVATAAGTYSVWVTDANGCQNMDELIVVENGLPIVDLGNDTAYCVGSSFSKTLDAGNVGATYNWNDGAASSQTFTATTAGMYKVVVTDANGCENRDSVTVTENALPLVDIGPTTIAYCAGTNFSQTLDAGNLGATYQWTSGIVPVATSQTYTVTSAGLYGVLVTDANGCQNVDGVMVTENSLPTVDLGNDLSYCVGTTFSQVLDAGNPGLAYNWNNGAAMTQTYTANTAGIYSVTVTDGNGCENSDQLTVTENALPVVDLGTDLAYCSGTNFSQTLDAGNTGASYNWNNGTANTQTFVVTSAGNYTVEVTDANGCVGADILVVVENSLPVVALGNDTSYCAGASFSLLLNAENPGASYSWNGGTFSSQIFAVSQAGTYGVVVTDANGCSNSDEVIVTENPLPGINLGNDTSYCAGSNFSLVLNAQNAGSAYVWNNGSITPTVTATQAGTYWVVVTNASGCVNADSLVVTENALPAIDLGADVSTLNTSYVLDAGVGYSSYSWTPGGQTSQQLLVTQSGTYTVTVSNANGCTASDEIVVSLGSVSVNENQVFDMALTVYPNPSVNYLFVKVPDYEGEVVMSILSVNGQRVFSQSYAGLSVNQALSVDVSGFQSGNYILQLRSEKFVINRRIIVSK